MPAVSQNSDPFPSRACRHSLLCLLPKESALHSYCFFFRHALFFLPLLFPLTTVVFLSFFLHLLYLFSPHTDISTSILKNQSRCSFPPLVFIVLSWFLTVFPSTLQYIYCSLTASFFHSIFRHSCSLFPLTPKFHICC